MLLETRFLFLLVASSVHTLMPNMQYPSEDSWMDIELSVVSQSLSESQVQGLVLSTTHSNNHVSSAMTEDFVPPESAAQSSEQNAPNPSTPHLFLSLHLLQEEYWLLATTRHDADSDVKPTFYPTHSLT